MELPVPKGEYHYAYGLKHPNIDSVTQQAKFIVEGRIQLLLPEVALLKDQLGCLVCYVGSARDYDMSLYIDTYGKMYGTWEDSGYYLGADANDALENLILGKELEIVLE